MSSHDYYKSNEYIDELQIRVTNNNRYWRQEYKRRAIHHYSNGTMMCACCGESTMFFLAIDHTNGGGNKHRKSIKVGSGISFYRWLAKNGYPDGFRVLCHNCNMAIGFYDFCPHTDMKRYTGMIGLKKMDAPNRKLKKYISTCPQCGREYSHADKVRSFCSLSCSAKTNGVLRGINRVKDSKGRFLPKSNATEEQIRNAELK